MMMPRTASQFPLRTHILLLLVILMVKTSHANAAADNINMCTTENEVTADGVNSLRLVGQTTEKRLTGALEYYCVREAEIKEEIKLLIRDIDQVAQSVKEAESSAETKLKLYVTLSSTVSKGLKQAKDVQNDIMSVRSRIFETFEEFGDVTPASVIYDDESEKLLERYIEKLLQLASFRMVLVDNYNRGLFVSSPNVLKEAYDQLMTKIERMMQGVKTTLLEKHVYLTANMITTIKEVIHDLIQTAEELQAKMKLSSSAYVEFLHHEDTTRDRDALVPRGEMFLRDMNERITMLDQAIQELNHLESSRKEVTDEYCRNAGSLNKIVFDMVEYSSPRGSPSYNKMHRVLNQASSFYINLEVPFFNDVAKNIATMLKGYGLQQETSAMNRNGVIHIKASVKPGSFADGCTESPRIVIQTEQLHILGSWYLKTLQDCHNAQSCIILEFSDFNYEWEKRHGLSDSVVLFPILIQSRLTKENEEVDSTEMKPLDKRSLDIVFFAYMLERRLELRQDIIDKHPDWNVQFEDNSDMQVMVKAYQDAKVCLVAHAYHPKSGGEYHRLSELATFGCIPVMEDFADSIAIDDYALCGGVVFAPYESLTETVLTVLQEIDAKEQDYISHVEWWKRGIQWDSVLLRMFDRRK